MHVFENVLVWRLGSSKNGEMEGGRVSGLSHDPGAALHK